MGKKKKQNGWKSDSNIVGPLLDGGQEASPEDRAGERERHERALARLSKDFADEMKQDFLTGKPTFVRKRKKSRLLKYLLVIVPVFVLLMFSIHFLITPLF